MIHLPSGTHVHAKAVLADGRILVENAEDCRQQTTVRFEDLRAAGGYREVINELAFVPLFQDEWPELTRNAQNETTAVAAAGTHKSREVCAISPPSQGTRPGPVC